MEEYQAAEHVAEKWFHDWRTKVHWNGGDLVNDHRKNHQSRVEPNRHMSYKDYCKRQFYVCLSQCFDDVGCDAGDIMKKRNYCADFPNVEQILTTHQVDGHNMVQSHLNEVTSSGVDEMIEQSTNMVPHCQNQVLSHLRCMFRVGKLRHNESKVAITT